MALEVGMKRVQDFTVGGPLLTDVGGTLRVSVLSTPMMIGMMEHNCTQLASRQLDSDHTTVGFEVCIRHVAGAPAGAHCEARACLREIVDARKLRFDVEVVALEDDGSERTIGVGTHERRIIEAVAHAAAVSGAS